MKVLLGSVGLFVGFFSPFITLGSEGGSDIGFFQIMTSALGPELCEILCVP